MGGRKGGPAPSEESQPPGPGQHQTPEPVCSRPALCGVSSDRWAGRAGRWSAPLGSGGGGSECGSWNPDGSPSPQESASSEVELTPEEKRVLERKLKKERKKEERKRLREAAAAAPAQPLPAKPSGAQLALDYLCG